MIVTAVRPVASRSACLSSHVARSLADVPTPGSGAREVADSALMAQAARQMTQLREADPDEWNDYLADVRAPWVADPAGLI